MSQSARWPAGDGAGAGPRHFVLLGAMHLAIAAAMHASGLTALSDDDYARTTIAQSFAAGPTLDPSGTSWLPFPFWATGTALAILSPSLEAVRASSLLFGVAATFLFFSAGRVWGASVRRAFAAAVAIHLLPVVAVLSAVSTPELPAAALGLFALAASATPSRSRPVAAGAAMLAATLSRYEAWPLSPLVALLLVRRRDASGPARRAGALLAAAGPLGWIVHSRLAHGDAFSFLHRVSAYRAALGAEAGGGGAALFGALLCGCPFVVAALAAALGSRALSDRKRGNLDGAAGWREAREIAPLGAGAILLVAFLAAGERLGGAPTHHPERALLLAWVLAAFAAVMAAPPLSFWRSAPLFALSSGSALALSLGVDAGRVLPERGVDRADEEVTGARLRALVAPGERVLVATTDYGYFAVLAAFGRPGAAVIDASHDPRVKGEKSLLERPWEAEGRLRGCGGSWLVGPSTLRFSPALKERARTGRLAIYELDPRG